MQATDAHEVVWELCGVEVAWVYTHSIYMNKKDVQDKKYLAYL